ncbi:MAG: hypothetical protein O3A82_16620 [Verrucomicrobia bacterium]|nr:hypothetical protein [Verrucomicrobiota bacterium]MDA1048536.1 hypothetical protein [Verrucomicrobiota bacterium]
MSSGPYDFTPALGKVLTTLLGAREETTSERRLGRTLLGFRELLEYEDHLDFDENERPVLDLARLKAVRFLLDNLPAEDDPDPTVWTKYYSFLSVEGAEARELWEVKEPGLVEVWSDFCSRLPEVMDEAIGLSRN